MKRQNAQPELDPAPADQANEGPPQPKTNGATPQGKTNGRPPAEPAETSVPFFEQLASISAVDWDNQKFRVYIYRIAPRIESQSENHYVGRLSAPLDEADLLARYGSGKYFLRLNDVQQRKTIASYTCAVYDPDVPPRIDRATLLDVPENAPYRAWIQRATTRQVGSDAGQQPCVPSEQTTEHAAARAVDKMAETVDKMAEITKTTLAKSDQRNSANDEPVSATVANLFVKMTERADSLSEKLSQQTTAAHDVDPLDALDRAVSLVKRLAPEPPPSPTPKSPLEQAREMLVLFSELKETFGGANTIAPAPGAADNGWIGMIVTQVGEVVKRPLELLVADLLSRRGGNAGMTQSPGIMQPPGMMQPPPDGTVPMPGQPPITTPPPGPSLSQEDINMAAVEDFIIPRLPAFLEALDSGMSGAEFAQELFETRPSLGGMNLSQHSQFKTLPKDKLLSLLASPSPSFVGKLVAIGINPIQLAAQMSGHQSLMFTFLEGFLSWEPEPEIPLPDDPPPASDSEKRPRK
jgi:hypothetical protein